MRPFSWLPSPLGAPRTRPPWLAPRAPGRHLLLPTRRWHPPPLQNRVVVLHRKPPHARRGANSATSSPGSARASFRSATRPPRASWCAISNSPISPSRISPPGHFYFSQKVARGAFGEAGFGDGSPGPLAWIDDWRLTVQPDGSWRITATSEGRTLELQLVSQKPPVIEGEHGISQKAAGDGHASCYYSLTRMKTTGHSHPSRPSRRCRSRARPGSTTNGRPTSSPPARPDGTGSPCSSPTARNSCSTRCASAAAPSMPPPAAPSLQRTAPPCTWSAGDYRLTPLDVVAQPRQRRELPHPLAAGDSPARPRRGDLHPPARPGTRPPLPRLLGGPDPRLGPARGLRLSQATATWN